jgi:peptidylprolyl isomerase
MRQAKPGDTVKVHYVGKLEDGTVFSSSADRDPIEITVGEKRVAPFEQALVGMQPGESKTVHVPAEQAYGPQLEELVVVLDRKQLPADLNPKVGQQLPVSTPDGRTVQATVTDVSRSSVTLDANHPWAGQDLAFIIQLTDIV